MCCFVALTRWQQPKRISWIPPSPPAALIRWSLQSTAELVDTLKGPGPFTVFAPNDAAFAKVPAADLEKLLQDKAALSKVLTYHVVPGKVKAADVVKLSSAKTVQGQELKISVQDGTVLVDGAKVISTDIETSNGVIHVIDSVVLPK